MRIVTLTTDFGYQDSYIAELKGVILGVNPKTRLVDLSHGIGAQNIQQAAFSLFLAYKYFPKGTIHVVVVDPGVGSGRRILLVKTRQFYFIVPDNGVLTYILNAEEKVRIREITNKSFFRKAVSMTFHGRDIMASVAGHLSKKAIFSEVGAIITDPVKIITPNSVKTKNNVVGEVIYIDHFGNMVTNITRAMLDEFCIEKINIGKKSIAKIVRTYSSVKRGVLLATYGSSDFLEIAINCGSAQACLTAKIGDAVCVYMKK